MAYTNSPLATYTRLSPHHSGQRTHAIDRITPHCIVGQWTAKQGVDYFATTDRDCSANYVVGKDGDIALGVEEKNRSWCSSSNANDQRAITIECASDTTAPYAFTTACYNGLVKLCVDICKRNGKKKLLWLKTLNATNNYSPKSDEMLLSVHRWFANKSCPGDWMFARMQDLADKVTAQLGGTVVSTPSTNKLPACPFLVKVIIDDLNIRKTAGMGDNLTGKYTGKGVFTIVETSNGWGRLKSGAGWIYLENPDYCTIVGSAVIAQPVKPDTKPEDNMPVIWEALKKAIGNEFGVAGVMGNIHAECSYRPENLQNTFEKSLGMTDGEYTAKVDSGEYSKDKFVHDSAGYGLAQWTWWSRKEALYEYAKSKGASIGDLNMQIEYLIKELKGYTNVWKVITNAKSIREASDVVLKEFERPADMSEAVCVKRASYGQTAYDKFHKEEVSSHKIVSGDTFESIAKKYGITVEKLIQLNIGVSLKVR